MEKWKAIAEDFQKLWNFSNCAGAIDGKHITIQAVANSDSQFHNYKGSFSVVLLAVVDARYHLRIIDMGAYGKSSDGGTLSSSNFGQALSHDAPTSHQMRLFQELKEPCPLFSWQTKHFLCERT
ncbi:Protein ALP1-like [Labeo rohita]|uniref:Protein ALP1-like n=1 Tax=Labeo rohita TaxID=84645 RepID=A0ABQ8MDT9_LABRO|nr:Protein ALP1-like [Labeo rohita]